MESATKLFPQASDKAPCCGRIHIIVSLCFVCVVQTEKDATVLQKSLLCFVLNLVSVRGRKIDCFVKDYTNQRCGGETKFLLSLMNCRSSNLVKTREKLMRNSFQSLIPVESSQ